MDLIKDGDLILREQPRRLPLSFTGSPGEYFRIWIVNLVLTILTLGIYGPWAKVRTRRYFYANTMLDGQPFDYLARPGALLKGHLIILGALVVMNISSRISPLIGYVVSAAAWSLVPYLLYKAHRFKAKNSAYRNIRFHFNGNVGGAYRAYAFIPIAVVLGLLFALPFFSEGQGKMEAGAAPNMAVVGTMVLSGLLLTAAYPYFAYLQRRYLHGNLAYGKTGSTFKGGARPFYGIYASAFFIMITASFAGSLFIAMTGSIVMGGSVEKGKIGVIGMGLIAYAVFGILFLLVQQYIYASTFNYAWGNTRLGPMTFSVTLKAKDLAWIRFTNILAIILSLGFLAPWAKVRRARYILPRTTVILPGDMDAFEAESVYEEGAVGDTAADFFDWDIGW